MKDKNRIADRRGFLLGAFASAGAASMILAGIGKKAYAYKNPAASEPIDEMYRRTEHVERYYKTLYS